MTYKQVKKAFQDKMGNVKIDADVKDDWVLTVLRKHPEWDEKTSHGLYTIRKVWNPMHVRRQWMLVVVDGTGSILDDISYDAACRAFCGLQPRKRPLVAMAARNHVHMSQVHPYRCTHVKLEENHKYEIDHTGRKEFKDLLADWLVSEGLSSDQVDVEQDRQTFLFRFRDERLAASWSAYHARHAELQVLTVEEHHMKRRRRS